MAQIKSQFGTGKSLIVSFVGCRVKEIHQNEKKTFSAKQIWLRAADVYRKHLVVTRECESIVSHNGIQIAFLLSVNLQILLSVMGALVC